MSSREEGLRKWKHAGSSSSSSLAWTTATRWYAPVQLHKLLIEFSSAILCSHMSATAIVPLHTADRQYINCAQGVVNRDIKLENTLLDGSKRPLLKICDFGYSKNDKDSVPKSKVGTPGYTGVQQSLAEVRSRHDISARLLPTLLNCIKGECCSFSSLSRGFVLQLRRSLQIAERTMGSWRMYGAAGSCCM